MFGYATDETEECMPLTVVLSHQLNAKIAELRRTGDLAWARPDTKSQVLVYFWKVEERTLRLALYKSNMSILLSLCEFLEIKSFCQTASKSCIKVLGLYR